MYLIDVLKLPFDVFISDILAKLALRLCHDFLFRSVFRVHSNDYDGAILRK